jgi:hypothetical protein
LQASELFPFGLPEHRRYKNSMFKAQNPFNLKFRAPDNEDASHQAPTPQELKAAFLVWGEAVLVFSQAKLTRETDKLIAISAIAREMQPLMQCRYLAGHWESDLVRQLP